MLIKCPECTKDVSNTVAACPHCGYVFEVSTTTPQLHRKQKAAVFQYISLVLQL
jgi:predicted amidophosphoribosyltransferase